MTLVAEVKFPGRWRRLEDESPCAVCCGESYAASSDVVCIEDMFVRGTEFVHQPFPVGIWSGICWTTLNSTKRRLQPAASQNYHTVPVQFLRAKRNGALIGYMYIYTDDVERKWVPEPFRFDLKYCTGTPGAKNVDRWKILLYC